MEGGVVSVVLGVVVLLLVATIVRSISQRVEIPFSILLVAVGAGIALLARAYPQLLGPVAEMNLSAELILFLFVPSLVFESAINLDVQQVKKSLGPILVLAVPGILLSTGLTAALITLLTPLPFAVALLLGAILSATDPVAVIAVFKRLGAPQRLLVLVEGESLFNDATSIVVARLVTGLVVGGGFALAEVGTALGTFSLVFFGGIGCGLAMGLLVGWVLRYAPGDSVLVITLTAILAYASFIVAEHFLHVSGVMATVAAGLTFSGWGWMRVNRAAREQLSYVWEYISFIATSLIFLLVGLSVDLAALASVLHLLPWVFLAMLVSRAVSVYGLLPLVNRFSHGPVDGRYRTVMFWGGLRGAIALALVLSLPEGVAEVPLEAIVLGAVVLTLLVHGLTIQPLVQLLGLDVRPLLDRMLLAFGRLRAKKQATGRIEELSRGGMFSDSIAQELQERYDSEIDTVTSEMRELAESRAGNKGTLLFLLLLSEEKSVYTALFNEGHLSEASYRELLLTISLQGDALRHAGSTTHVRYTRFRHRRWEEHIMTALQRTRPLTRLAERIRRRRLALDYELAWAHFRGSRQVLRVLDDLASLIRVDDEERRRLAERYERWYRTAEQGLDETAERFPEFTNAMQEQMAARLLLLTEYRAIEGEIEEGMLPEQIGRELLEDLTEELQAQHGHAAQAIGVDPDVLIRGVPLFAALPEPVIEQLCRRLQQYTVNPGHTVVHQGDTGDALYVIARGVVRVLRDATPIATLFAGDFFGEGALLRGERRNATIRAVTPSVLYELGSRQFNETIAQFPDARRLVEEADAERGAE
jgi:CPA1 family monovalent cation:H+ antiporter